MPLSNAYDVALIFLQFNFLSIFQSFVSIPFVTTILISLEDLQCCIILLSYFSGSLLLIGPDRPVRGLIGDDELDIDSILFCFEVAILISLGDLQ